MKITEWTERNLYVNKDLKVLDNSMNEYRDDDGQIQYLELPNRLFKRMNDVLEDMYFTYSSEAREPSHNSCIEDNDEPESFDNWYGINEVEIAEIIKELITDEV